MIRYTIKRYKEIGIIFFLIVWQLISSKVGNAVIMPTPLQTLESIMKIATSKSFYPMVSSTIERTAKGFLIAFATGMLTGMLSGFYRWFREFTSPLIAFVKSAPTMGIILLVLIWMRSDQAPILIGFLVVFPIIHANIAAGIENMDKNMVEMAKIYKISPIKRFSNIYLPAIKPNIKTSLLNAFGLNLKVVIAAEVISQPELSIGNGIFLEKVNINTSGVFAWIFIVVFIVYVWDVIAESLMGGPLAKRKTIIKK